MGLPRLIPDVGDIGAFCASKDESMFIHPSVGSEAAEHRTDCKDMRCTRRVKSFKPHSNSFLGSYNLRCHPYYVSEYGHPRAFCIPRV